MPSNRPSFASLPRDLHDDATCTTLMQWSKPPDVDACPHTVFIRSSVLRHEPTNLLPLGFEAQIKKRLWWFWGPNRQTIDLSFETQTKKSSWWFWGQTTNKPSPLVLRLNWKTRVSHLLHVYDVDQTRCHPTSRSSGHWVLDMCLIIPDPPHQVSYSCPPCRIRHLYITR
jgi:hypothetical protein